MDALKRTLLFISIIFLIKEVIYRFSVDNLA